VTLDNQDIGVLHNIAFYTSNRATEKIAVGNLVTGPATDTLTFTAPDRPGTYFFRCDVHPDTMTGAFSVK
jgi:plastocyanin